MSKLLVLFHRNQSSGMAWRTIAWAELNVLQHDYMKSGHGWGQGTFSPDPKKSAKASVG